MSDLLSLSHAKNLPIAAQPLLTGPAPGIVHLGLGAFHRAHQAVFTEEAMAEAGGDWGIVEVAPRSAATVDALKAQDLLYSVTSLAATRRSTRVVGSVAGAMVAAQDPAAVVALLADPRIRIVTLTVTEKGYWLDPATGTLLDDPALLADLQDGASPRTVPGILAQGLKARLRADAGPIALVSCDNLPSNGKRLHGLMTQVADRVPGLGIASFVREHVTFPGTMVDRIVPATTPALLDEVAAELGARDLAAVAGEPYSQWVIEDAFPGGRPAWEQAGAVLTDDPEPWELLKLRALNGVHSAIAYLGAVAGCSMIAEAVALPGMIDVMRAYLEKDVSPTFTPPEGTTVVRYGNSSLERFANPAIRHRTVQVAMDGTQKLPQRLLHTISACRAAGEQAHWATLAVAGWMRYVQGTADDGSTLPLDDPMAGEIRTRLTEAPSTPAGVVDALLGLTTVFDPALASDDTFREQLVTWLTELTNHGVAPTLEAAGRRA